MYDYQRTIQEQLASVSIEIVGSVNKIVGDMVMRDVTHY